MQAFLGELDFHSSPQSPAQLKLWGGMKNELPEKPLCGTLPKDMIYKGD